MLSYQVIADTNVWIALEGIRTSKSLCIFESSDDECEAIIWRSPAVSMISQGDKVGSGDDETVASNWTRIWVTRDVSLKLFYWVKLPGRLSLTLLYWAIRILGVDVKKMFNLHIGKSNNIYACLIVLSLIIPFFYRSGRGFHRVK